ncbi:hypothetical protein HBI23_056170 [Parastagonospora nodorum]|nr:hypothetical protein HBI79_074040 [Parastagonospora nodorum]KAH5337875.1 hypothetical protein HBI12_014340 [Parastagonospora nodorum]KAH5678101.1 hypothetical protein HBI23_056170 [Parastagonospora nodorum]KAH6060513.1 hypothetical protein HBI66_197180 [Parastagonospora nodorum]KAH6063298.1 hypothetical protein HBI67_138350 [Parastagonospora nodorum]
MYQHRCPRNNLNPRTNRRVTPRCLTRCSLGHPRLSHLSMFRHESLRAPLSRTTRFRINDPLCANCRNKHVQCFASTRLVEVSSGYARTLYAQLPSDGARTACFTAVHLCGLAR